MSHEINFFGFRFGIEHVQQYSHQLINQSGIQPINWSTNVYYCLIDHLYLFHGSENMSAKYSMFWFCSSWVRAVQNLETAITTLEGEYEKVEALKVDVAPMQSVKKNATITDEIKQPGAQLMRL